MSPTGMTTLKCKYCDFTVPRYNRNGYDNGFKKLREHCDYAHKEIAKLLRPRRGMKNPYVEIEKNIADELREDPKLDVDVLGLGKQEI